MMALFNSKSSKKALVLCTIAVFIFIFYLSSIYSSIDTGQNNSSSSRSSYHKKKPFSSIFSASSTISSIFLDNKITCSSKKKLFTNFNKITSSAKSAKKSQEKILVLTPLKDAEAYLDRYFELLDRTIYPNYLISLAFLVSDSSDNTIASLQSHIQKVQSRSWWRFDRFDSVRIFKKDFDFDLPNDQRHKYEMQPLRRSIMARSRNWLLSAALKPDISWVAWIDVDVVEYPKTIFEDLMRADVDVVVPNCLLDREDHAFWAYDKNNWQETDDSRKVQEGLEPDFVLLEGYYEFPTYRYLVSLSLLLVRVLKTQSSVLLTPYYVCVCTMQMVDMPTDVASDYKVPLDGVGATFTLVKAHVHREGALFPAFPYQHQVETEGFAKIAKAMGFSVYGLPGYIIYHVQNH